MSDDLEARVVQAAREAVSMHVPPWATMGPNEPERQCIVSGRFDSRSDVHWAILGARAALAEIERDGGWQPIETAPRDGTPVLLVGGVSDWEYPETAKYQCVAWWEEDCWFVALAEAGCVFVARNDPTHWMPLPKSPYGK